MSVRLGPLVRQGGVAFAAISRDEVRGRRWSGRLVFAGEKIPLAVILRSGGGVAAFDIAGHRLDRDKIEALAPGEWERFSALSG